MPRTLGYLPAALFGLALAAPMGQAGDSAAAIGAPVGDLQLTDVAGKRHALHELRGKDATVVVFLSFDCPISVGYCDTLARMTAEYRPRGVACVGIVCAADAETDLPGKVKECKVPFTVLRDDDCRAADLFGATATPEAFVLDRAGVLRYRGRIDNAYAARLKRNSQTTSQDLRSAIDDVLAGRPVASPATQPVGCPITRPKPAPVTSGPVTYYRDVLPILQKNCQSCHRPGEVGPFALTTYRQTVNWASDIKDYTRSRKMPPWKPAEGGPFQNERSLSEADVRTLAAWADGGMPEGNPKDAPPPRRFADGWQLGTPDLVLEPTAEFRLGGTGKDVFRCFVLPTNLTDDRFVSAVEVRPGNPRVVHHALLFVDAAGKGRKLEAAARLKAEPGAPDGGPGYSVGMGVGFVPQGGMGGWAPGVLGRRLPAGTAYYLPKGSDVVVQVHYHRDGRPETDRIRVGLYFSKEPVSRRYQGITVAGNQAGGRFFMIPAGATDFHVRGSVWVDQECDVYSVMPHMHLTGRSVRVTMTSPGESAQTLVAIPDWDYNWQEIYFFERPIHVRPGTRFDIDAAYDNSAGNPNNPSSPPRLITFGEETTNEMCFGFLGAASDRPGRIAQRRKPLPDAAKAAPQDSKPPAGTSP